MRGELGGIGEQVLCIEHGVSRHPHSGVPVRAVILIHAPIGDWTHPELVLAIYMLYTGGTGVVILMHAPIGDWTYPGLVLPIYMLYMGVWYTQG